MLIRSLQLFLPCCCDRHPRQCSQRAWRACQEVSLGGRTWGLLSGAAASQVAQARPSTLPCRKACAGALVSDWSGTVCSTIWRRRSTSCSPGPGPEAHCSEGLKYSCLVEAVLGAVGSAPFAHRNGKCLNPRLDFFFFFKIQVNLWGGQVCH